MPEPALNSTVPADGASYPGNAALLFSGFDITLDAVTVTVDGQPASFVPADFAAGFANIAVLVEPQPQAGQTVVVAGNFCPIEFCEPVTLTYTASAPDEAPPAPIAAMSYFGVYDHADFMSSGGDCQADRDLTFYVHIAQAAPGAGEAVSVLKASWDPDGDGGSPGFWSYGFASGEGGMLVIPTLDAYLGGKDPATEVCVKVEAVDTAGNTAPAFEICPACYFRKDDAPQSQVPPEPQWSDADAVPGSACAAGGGSTGEATTDTGSEPTGGGTGEPQTSGEPPTSGDTDTGGLDEGKGCACSSSSGGPLDLGALLFGLALGTLHRRRRRAG